MTAVLDTTWKSEAIEVLSDVRSAFRHDAWVYGAFVIYCMLANVSYTNIRYFRDYETLAYLVRLLVIGLLVVLCVLRVTDWRGAAASLALIMVGLLVRSGARDTIPLVNLLFVAAGAGLSHRHLAHCYLATTIPLMIATIALFVAGIVPQTVLEADGTQIYSLGYLSPNRLAGTVVCCCMSLLILRFPRGRIGWEVPVAIAATVLVYLPARSTTAMLTSVVMISLYVVAMLVNQHGGRWLRGALGIGSAFFAIASVVLMVTYTPKNPVMRQVDALLTTRITLANDYFREFGLTPFGVDISQLDLPVRYLNENDVHASIFVVDNAYCHLLLHYGVVLFLCLMVALALYWFGRRRADAVDAWAFGLFVMLFFGLGETNMLFVDTNYALLGFRASHRELPESSKATRRHRPRRKPHKRVGLSPDATHQLAGGRTDGPTFIPTAGGVER